MSFYHHQVYRLLIYILVRVVKLYYHQIIIIRGWPITTLLRIYTKSSISKMVTKIHHTCRDWVLLYPTLAPQVTGVVIFKIWCTLVTPISKPARRRRLASIFSKTGGRFTFPVFALLLLRTHHCVAMFVIPTLLSTLIPHTGISGTQELLLQR